MKIGLIDVDGRVMHGKKCNGSRYPNLALMKISAYHKANGDEVEWCFPLKRYDRVYASKIFTFSPDIDFDPLTDDFRRGGSGYDLTTKLPDEIEHIMPDNSLYGVRDTAYGFMSRGCPRGCPFCIVGAKEGRESRKVADLSEWWNGQRHIKLLDPNVLACRDWADILGQLAESGAKVDISQGLDIRLMTPERIDAINRINIDSIHFAWDNPRQDLAGLFDEYAKRARQKFHKTFATVYILTNYWSTMEENLRRIYILRDMGYEPYVMVYDRQNAPNEVRRLQRWCNNKAIFRSTPNFNNYKP